MSAKHYPFMVGDIRCTVLLDGASLLGRERILKRFHDATEADYRQAYAEIGLSLDTADTSFNILVASIGDQTVLVDSGEGGKPYGGHLLASMRLAGIEPDAITLVVITHVHGDHILGLLSDNQEAVFPRATYVLSKTEMSFWRERLDNGFADQRPIVTMIEQQGLRLIDMDEQIVSGMIAVPLPGHTPGHIGIVIESEQEQFIHMADLLHLPIQFAHPGWSALFDHDTNVSVPTRWSALGRAADEQTLTLFYHLTFPGLGRVTRAGRGFSWHPVGAEVIETRDISRRP